MCGFVGMVFRDPQQQPDETRLRAASKAIEHRGPDAAGLWAQPGIAMAHQRLSILDVEHGQQPVIEDRYALVYNGEVYNYEDIKRTYQQRGETFTTRCDTEVVFRSLANDGKAAVDQYNGMFAFAHFDRVERQLLLTRDRLGQKPLYWFADDSRFAFASELKALLVLLDEQFDIDPVAIDQYFTKGYILSPRTIFQQIRKLPAACHLSLDAKQWKWDVAPYWDYQPQETPNDETQAIDQLDELLSDSVRMRLVSDVPLGCLLSGGIDSTLITAMASRARQEPIDAFSMGFDGASNFSELQYAKMVAEAHGCRWHERRVVTDDFPTVLDEVSDYFDEPFANFAMFPMRRLAQLAREELTVVLSGQGGDELAAGYPGRYGWATQQPPNNTTFSTMDNLTLHLHHSSIIPWQVKQSLFSTALSTTVQSQFSGIETLGSFWDKHKNLDRLNGALYADVKTNLPDYLVCVEERMTMSTSLEARNPMLDHRVVNYLLSLPASMKVKGKQFKWILLELAKRYGPVEAIDRPKQGFTPPIRDWINSSGQPLAKLFSETDSATRAIYSNEWRQYLRDGRYNSNNALATYFSAMFAKWVQKFGRYMKPIEADTLAPQTSAQPARTNWHTSLREANNTLLAQGRLYRALFNDLPKDETILILGDVDGWYTRLAAIEGLNVARYDDGQLWSEQQATERTDMKPVERYDEVRATAQPYRAVLGITVDAIEPLLTLQGIAPGAKAVLLLPFESKQAPQLQNLLNQLVTQLKVDGHQTVPYNQQQAALVLSCQLPETKARQSA